MDRRKFTQSWGIGTDYEREKQDLYLMSEYGSDPFSSQLKKNPNGTSLYEGDKEAQQAYLDEKGKGYGIIDWFKDAWSEFFQSMNKAQADDFAGQSQRAQEYLDLVLQAKKYIQDQQKYDAIQQYLNKKAAGANVSKEISALKKYFPNLDSSKKDSDKLLRQQQFNIGNDILLGDGKKAYETLNKMTSANTSNVFSYLWSKLGIATHDNSETFDDNSIMGPMQDWFGDRVTDASVLLHGMDVAKDDDKLKMMDSFTKQLQDVQKYSKRAYEQNMKESEWYEKAHHVSEYYKGRISRSQMEMQNGGSIWTIDNLLYANTQQMGFSSSSWDKLGTSLVLSIAAAVATGGTSTMAQVAAAGLGLTGAAAQYSAGKSENNAQAIEDLQIRIGDALQKNGVYDQVIADGKNKFKNASDQEIIEKIAHGEYIPEKSKALHVVANAVQESLAKSRAGINAVFERNQYAVATDAMVDAMLYGVKLPKGLGSGLTKAVNAEAKFTPVKQAGKWVMDRAGKGVGKAYGAGFESGLGLPGGIAAGTVKVGLNLVEQGLRATPKNGIVRNAMAWAQREVNAGRRFISKAQKAFHTEDLVKDNMRRKYFEKYLGKPASFLGEVATSGYSEAVEEGKQYLNGQEWLQNEDPDRVVSFMDGVMRDMTYGAQLIAPALGVPFGARWGLADKGELYLNLMDGKDKALKIDTNDMYSNMAGGWLGGAMHTAMVSGFGGVISAFTTPDRISISDAIAQNAELGRNSALSRFTKGSDLVSKVYKDPNTAMREFEEYRDFNNKRREMGLSHLSWSQMNEEERYMKLLTQNANSIATKQQADAAGIVEGTKEWFDFVSAKTMMRDIAREDLDTMNKLHAQQTTLLHDIVASQIEEDEDIIAASTILGDEYAKPENPLLGVLKTGERTGDNTTAKKMLERKQREEEHANKAAEGNKTSQDALNIMQENDAEKALEASVAATRSNETIFATEGDEATAAARIIAEIVALKELYDNIDVADAYSEKESHHDSNYFKHMINKRLTALKKKVKSDKIDSILSDGKSYFADQERFEALKNSFQEAMCAQVNYAISTKLGELLSGQMKLKRDEETGKFIKDGWHLSKAKDVIAKLNQSVESEYELIDDVNKFYEREQLGISDVNNEIRRPEAVAPQEVQQPQQTTPAATPTQPTQTSQPVQTPQPTPTPIIATVATPEQQVATTPTQLVTSTPTEAPAEQRTRQFAEQAQPTQTMAHEVIPGLDAQVNQALDTIENILGLARLSNQQIDPNGTVDPELDRAGQIIMRTIFGNEVYDFKQVIAQAYDIFVKGRFTDDAINTVIPLFARWYLAESADSKYDSVADKFTSRVDMSRIDPFDIVNNIRFAQDDSQSQREAYEQWKEDERKKLGLVHVFENIDEIESVPNNINLSVPCKIGIVNDGYGIDIYEVAGLQSVSDGSNNITDLKMPDGVYVKRHGVVLTYEEIQRQYEQLSLTTAQQDVFDRIEEVLSENDKQVVGEPTSHDYFVREADGKIHLYPRVHTVNGSQYGEENSKTIARRETYEKVLQLIRNGQYDAIKDVFVSFTGKFNDRFSTAAQNLIERTVGDVKDLQRYVDFLQQWDNPSESDMIAAAEAIAELAVQEPSSVAVVPGEMADKIVRMFFDEDEASPVYETFTIDMNGKTIAAKDIMTQQQFNDFLSDLDKVKAEYDRLGYKISTKVHTIFTTIQGPNGPQRVAGQTDIIAVDQFGHVHIIDTKTSRYTFIKELTSAQGVVQGPFYSTPKLFGKYDTIRNTVEQYSVQLSTYMQMLKTVMPELVFSKFPLEILPVKLDYDYKSLERNVENPGTPTAIRSMRVGAFSEPDRILLDITSDIFSPNMFSQEVDLEEIDQILEEMEYDLEHINQFIDDVISDIEDANNVSVVAQLKSAKQIYEQAAEMLRNAYVQLSENKDNQTLDLVKQSIADIQTIKDQAIQMHDEAMRNVQQPVVQEDTIDERANDINAINNINVELKAIADQWCNAVNQNKSAHEIRAIYDTLKNKCDELKNKIAEFKSKYANADQHIPSYSNELIKWVEQDVYNRMLPMFPKTDPRQQVHGGFGWMNYNTVDRRTQEASVAEDDPSIRLSDVCGEPEFAEQAVVEVVGDAIEDYWVRYNRTDTLIPVKISYKGHTFSTVRIRIADNQHGVDFLATINRMKEQLQPGDKIILTEMDRTEGMFIESDNYTLVTDSPIVPVGMSFEDISMDASQSMFGIAKQNGQNAPVEIWANGKRLYTYPTGKGTPGVVCAVITPDYKNKSLIPEPLQVPLQSAFLSDSDIQLIIDLSYKNPTDPVMVTKQNGTKSNLGITTKDLLDLILPYGVTIQQVQQMREQNMDALRQMLAEKRINVIEKIAAGRLSTNDSNPVFRAVARWFKSRDNISEGSLQLSSAIKFERSDFNNDGLSGLAWMMKNGSILTNVDKLVNPRFSFNNAEIQRAESNVPQTTSTAPIIEVTENDDAVVAEDAIWDDDFNLDDFGVDNSTDVQNGEELNKKIVEDNVRRILGDVVPVEVVDNYTRMILDFPPGLAGRCFRDLIYVSTHATPGTEYHEAFHRVYRLLLPEKIRKHLDKAIRKAYAKSKGKIAAEHADRNALNEFAANKCQRYFNMQENIKFDLKRPFEFIRQHYLAYKHIGSARLYFFYMAMSRGLFRNKQILAENENQLRNVKIADNKIEIHGREFSNLFNLRQYNTMLQSFAYYICKAQSIDPSGSNINDLDLSVKGVTKKFKYTSYVRYAKYQADAINKKNEREYQEALAKGEKPKRRAIIHEGDIRKKDGEYLFENVEQSVEEMMMNSCKNESVKPLISEMIENWDVVKLDLINYMKEIGINYKTEEDRQYEKMMLAGDLMLDEENEGFFALLLKESSESSQTTRASKGVKCLASMIKEYKLNDKGEWKEVRNECGFYKHMDYKDVLNIIYSDCHAVKSPSEMMQLFQRKANEGHPVYRQIFEIVRPYYKDRYKGGRVDANKEQFITQLFNNVACTQNQFKTVMAHFDKKNKKYAHSIKNCGQDYESRELRRGWGKMLMYGGNDIFYQRQDGLFDIVHPDSIDRLGRVYDTFDTIRAFFTDQNMRAIAMDVDQKPILKLNVPNLRINRELDLSNSKDINILKRDICLMFNYLGIQMSVQEFDYMLSDRFGQDFQSDLAKLNQFFNAEGSNSITNLWNSKSGIHVIKKDAKSDKWIWNINSVANSPSANTIIHNKQHKYSVNAEDVYSNNPFVRMLSESKYKYQHQKEDMSVLVTDNKRYYTISENNLISDVTDELSKGGAVADTLNSYCYNIYTDQLTDPEGNTIEVTEGSILLKAVKELAAGRNLDLKVCTLSQFKSDEEPNEGHDYFDISEVEDYVAKTAILEGGNIIFPTMSDKKTWVYIDLGTLANGKKRTIPGIKYDQIEGDNEHLQASNLDDTEALQQLVEYARTELRSVEQTLKQLKELEAHPERKVLNFHKGSWVDITKNSAEEAVEELIKYKYISRSEKDRYIAQFNEKGKVLTANERGRITKGKNGKIIVSHNIPNGAMFGSFNGVYDENGKYISFNRVIDENGNFVSPEQNLALAKKYFFEGLTSDEQRRQVILRAIDVQTNKELKHMIKLGLIEKKNGVYVNKGLNSMAIDAIQKALGNIPNAHSVAIERYAKDITLKSIQSINEVERVFSGNPAFFKYQFKKVTKNGKTYTTLVNRKADEFKRLGGLISTGVNNNTEIKGIPEDGMYTCAIINDVEVGSNQVSEITRMMSEAEWRAAYVNLFKKEDSAYVEEDIWESDEDKIHRERYESLKGLPKDSTKKKIHRHYNLDRVAYKASIETIKKAILDEDESTYKIIEKKIEAETKAYESKINVADGAAYISPEMTEWLLRMCGSYDARVQRAFEILKDPTSNIEQQAKAYKLVTTKVIGAQKYTAYGQRLSEDGTTTIPYYNKMALFPVFKCISKGQFAKLHDQMQKQGVHMLMMESAVKIGAQGSQDWSADDSFKFNTFKQSFKYLRKQFNTDPHHQEDQSMGTQMVKVALASLLQDHDYVDHNGNTIKGHQMLKYIMDDINKMCDDGETEIRKELFKENGELDIEKFSLFLHKNLTSRDADMSIVDSISLVPNGDGTYRMNHPLSAISRMSWLQSILASHINDKMINVNTKGSAFYQRSIFGMEGPTVMTDENMPSDLNDGKELQMIIEDGPAKGAMDCVLSIDYFADLLEKAGLQNASFAEQKRALMQAGVIGPNAKANLIGYRIPTQAQSSIHPLRCVDVLPVIQHTIMLPKEFTKITGSDFDIDKIYIGSLDYDVDESELAMFNSVADPGHAKIFTEKEDTANDLINRYITILKDKTSAHIAHRSIDNDTTLLTDLLKDIESDVNNNEEYEVYDFYALRTHTETKNDFLTGKTGIGPFALNNNSQILTALYGVEFNEANIMSKLGHGSLHETADDYGQSIMSWISALINAHVDIAKDPYISRLNVNQMTYNLVNLMIRTGYGESTFYFTTQPVMKAMAAKYRQASTEFMKEEGKTVSQIRREAKRSAAIEYCGEQNVEWAEKFLLDDRGRIIEDKSTQNNIDMHDVIKYILRKNGNELRDSSKGSKNNIVIPDGKGGQISINHQQYQALIYVIDNVFESPAQSLSDVVKYSKIDTKKQGKNISEQIAYAKGVASTFGDRTLLNEIFGEDVNTVDETVVLSEIQSPFNDGLRRMYEESFIKHKTHKAISMFSGILRGQVIEASPAFQRTVSRIAEALGRNDDKFISKISEAMSTKLKADSMLQYALDNDINIPGLVTGQNTIYDRLLRIQYAIHNSILPQQGRDAIAHEAATPTVQPDLTFDFSHLRDVDGTPKNALLKLLIADRSDSYNLAKHPYQIPDKFGNLKFVRLFDALDISSSKTDIIIQAWEDLLNDPNEEVRQFARDLCVYAFYTSGGQMGRTKLFTFVPNQFREECGYVDYVRKVLAELQSSEWSRYNLDSSFIDDVILNNHFDKDFIRKVNVTKKKNPTDPDWVQLNAFSYKDENGVVQNLVNYGGYSYTPGWSLFLTRGAYVDPKEAPMYIKVKRPDEEDGFNRSYTIYKCIHRAKDPSGSSKIMPIYVKVNPRGYKMGSYTYFEYGGARVVDNEFTPYANRIKENHNPDVQNPYFNNDTLNLIVEHLRNKGMLGDELLHGQSEQWIGYKTYAPTQKQEEPHTETYGSVRYYGPTIRQQGMQLEDGKSYTAQEILEAYMKMPGSKVFEKVAKVAFEAAEKLGVTFTVNNSIPASGVSHKYGGVEFNLDKLQNNTLLHETIHAVVNYWIDNEASAPAPIKQAIAELRACYDGVLDYYLTKIFPDYAQANAKHKQRIRESNVAMFALDENTYGLSSFEEFIAELSNPKLRALLQEVDANEQVKKSILQRVIDAVYYVIAKTLGYTSVERASYQALKTLMTNINAQAYKDHQIQFQKIKQYFDFVKNCGSKMTQLTFEGQYADILYDRMNQEDMSVHTMQMRGENEIKAMWTRNDYDSIGPGSLIKLNILKSDGTKDEALGVITNVVAKQNDRFEFEWRLTDQIELADNMYVDKFNDRIVMDNYQFLDINKNMNSFFAELKTFKNRTKLFSSSEDLLIIQVKDYTKTESVKNKINELISKYNMRSYISFTEVNNNIVIKKYKSPKFDGHVDKQLYEQEDNEKYDWDTIIEQLKKDAQEITEKQC